MTIRGQPPKSAEHNEPNNTEESRGSGGTGIAWPSVMPMNIPFALAILVCSSPAAIALGRLVRPEEQRNSDRIFVAALRRYYRVGKDDQTRYFSLISLARIGGEKNREFLLQALEHGSGSLERPWAALALGCAVFRDRTQRRVTTDHAAISAAIHTAFRRATTPYAKGAIAVSLGLCGYTPAAESLLEQLRTHGHQDELSGYLCVGLALMNYKKARDPIAALLDSSIRQPHRLRMAAVALGKLGDRRISHHLLSLLAERTPNVAKMAAVSGALVQIGDRDSITPLREMPVDRDQPALTRAFAAVALGGIADKETLPWNAKLAVDMNYRAAVETLIQSGTSILEIL